MITVKFELPKFKVFEYDSRRGHIPNDLSVLNENFAEIMELALVRDLALNGIDSEIRVVDAGPRTVFYTPEYAIVHTVQKFNKKRVNSGKKRVGDFGQPVTKFIVAYPSHIIVRCYLIPKNLIKMHTQYDKHFKVTLSSYKDIFQDIYDESV